MDGIVRPAIRLASQELPSSSIQYDEALGSIRVWTGHVDRGTAGQAELLFICERSVLRISTRMPGRRAATDQIDIESVSEDLVVNKIAGFLQDALGLDLDAPTTR
jgi:hypothetical protein